MRFSPFLAEDATDPLAVCDLDYDPFLLMEEKGKKYGFVVSIYEYIEVRSFARPLLR